MFDGGSPAPVGSGRSLWLLGGLGLSMLLAAAIIVSDPAAAVQLWLVAVGIAALAALAWARRRTGQVEQPQQNSLDGVSEATPVPDESARLNNAGLAPAAVEGPPPTPSAGTAQPTAVTQKPTPTKTPGATTPPSDVTLRMAIANRPVMTAEEAATLLRVDLATVVAAINEGTLPGNRIGVHWRLRTSAVLRWLDGAYNPP